MEFLWLIILPQLAFGYGMYGTKRYERAVAQPNPSWVPLPVYRQQQDFSHTPAYYNQIVYPYAQEYPNNYYYPSKPVIHYPSYAVVRPIHKLEMYQGYPHYYTAERGRPVYGDYDAEPMENLHDEMLQEEAREEREDALPIGQETWYEGETSNYDDVNAAFLQNLILSQMYKDSVAKEDEDDSFEDNTDIYNDRNTREFEDVDVRQLKALAGKPLYHVGKTNKMIPDNDYGIVKTKISSTPLSHEDKDYKQYYDDQKYFNEDYPNDDAWINWASKRSQQKPTSKAPKKTPTENRIKSTPAPTTTTAKPTTLRIVKDGQKEEVLLRPATPVRHPFPEPVMKMLATESSQIKHSPSVYETIKHLLAMEADMKDGSGGDSRLRKRFVASEGDLIGELRGLKNRNRA